MLTITAWSLYSRVFLPQLLSVCKTFLGKISKRKNIGRFLTLGRTICNFSSRYDFRRSLSFHFLWCFLDLYVLNSCAEVRNSFMSQLFGLWYEIWTRQSVGCRSLRKSSLTRLLSNKLKNWCPTFIWCSFILRLVLFTWMPENIAVRISINCSSVDVR